MKYAIVAVLLFVPLMAQDKQPPANGSYLWALDQLDAEKRAECKQYTDEAKLQAMVASHKVLIAQVEKDNADYNSLAERYNKLLDAHQELVSSYRLLALSPPQQTVRTEYRDVEQPTYFREQPRQVHCTASSSPLGTTVITGVNCY